ncbi:MAG TPA: uroporphyrinogen decarboxylase [Solirubrobacteraceae bacterium]|nr:uroporphyrinogen decarboxylase [Solirubrobacteraceae bacterium]
MTAVPPLASGVRDAARSVHAPLLRAFRGEPVERTPVWFMRQAGRSLSEYRAIRSRANLFEIVRSPELTAEVTIAPVSRLGVDAAILFSDITVPLAAIGIDLEIVPGVGPVIAQPLRGWSDLARLRPFEPDRDAPYVADAVRLLVRELDVPLIGFAGGPFTLASYLIEGGPSKTHVRTRAMMYGDPDLFRELLSALAEIALASLRSQVLAGAAAIQLFESWVGVIDPVSYRRHVLPATARIFDGLRDLDVPTVYFGVGTGELLTLMGTAGSDVVGVDWRVPIDAARARLGRAVAVQGNLDPVACLAPWSVVRERALDVLRRAGPTGHVFNLGHGVLPETDPEILRRIVDLVHGYRVGSGAELTVVS